MFSAGVVLPLLCSAMNFFVYVSCTFEHGFPPFGFFLLVLMSFRLVLSVGLSLAPDVLTF